MLAVRQCTLAFLFVAVAGFRRCEELMIDADIILRHPCGGKALLELLAHLSSVERDDPRQRRDRRFHTVQQWPVRPFSMISGTEPHRKARTGVPQAKASIMASQFGN